MRVLVTGSRDWDDWATIVKALMEVVYITMPGEKITLVHGAARGTDDMCAQGAAYLGWQVEPHPANWQTQGRKAGILRNIEMVRLGADVCLAFIKNHSRGATHCSDAAERAGIPTRRYYA